MLQLLMALSALQGCSEYEIGKIPEPVDEVYPEIEVTPTELNFSMLSDGDTEILAFDIENIGDAPLEVSTVTLTGGAFTILTDMSAGATLNPGDITQVEVAFSPLSDGVNEGFATVFSDDADEPEVDVTLRGSGAAPDLIITPETHDFGTKFIPCDDVLTLTISNEGMEAATIDELVYTGDGQFILEDDTLAYPVVVNAGEQVQVDVRFVPDTVGAASGSLEVYSNDPKGVLTATQEGVGAFAQTVVDTAEAATIGEVDILFAVDQSCSMDGHSTTLGNNFSYFIQELNNYTQNWHIGVVTLDSGCFNGGVLTPSTPNYQATFQSAVTQGTDASVTNDENLFILVDRALSQTGSGGCNAGFLRSNALLHIIFASDEREQSGTPASAWYGSYLNYVAGPDQLMASGLLDINRSCSGGSGPGGYIDMVTATGGVTYDVCQSINAQTVQDLAQVTASRISNYELSSTAHPSSLEVYVDGVLWTSGYTYDPTTNTVTFTVELPEGADVEFSYGVSIECSP